GAPPDRTRGRAVRGADRRLRDGRPGWAGAARRRCRGAQGARRGGRPLSLGQHPRVGDARSRAVGGAPAVSEVDQPAVAIFDMDGVLVDSEPHHHAAWRRLCLEEGVALTLAEVAERTLGRPVRESLPTLLGRALDADEHERLVRRKAVIYHEVSGGTVREVRGVVAFVRTLAESGVRCGLATSALPERVGPILDALE